ncbi:MAG TPA: carboxypeptidase regulatory-like domain-containing protein [Bacteroidota bacterium]|jgi:hypothetical protein|nr:carboxypeptidase regulatory-like domain-containing protein [Bacteroidota bacterium]
MFYSFHNGSCLKSIAAAVVVFLFVASSSSFVSAQYKEITVEHGGTIRGKVSLKGDLSKVSRMEVTKDNKTCGKVKPFSCLSVGKNSGMANTFVYLEGITQGKRFDAASTYTLHQHKCEYAPHAMIVPLGSRLEIVNEDPILHNVHTYLDGKTRQSLFNIAQPMKGIRTKTKPMEKPGLVLATCDAGHPWMFAHVMVAEHPYYAITDANGNFSLTDVPAGTYTVKYWHEGICIANKVTEEGKVSKYEFEPCYEDTRQITVTSGAESVANFEVTLR